MANRNDPEQVPAILGRGLVAQWFADCMEAGGGDPESVAAELAEAVEQRDVQIANLEAQRDDLRRILDDQRAQIDQLRRERDRARTEANQLRRDLKSAQDELAAALVGRRETYSRREK